MGEKKHITKNYKIIEIYSVLILIATIFMSIGYAKISDIKVSITGDAKTKAQTGVFITDVTTTDEENTTINNYTGTILDSEVI